MSKLKLCKNISCKHNHHGSGQNSVAKNDRKIPGRCAAGDKKSLGTGVQTGWNGDKDPVNTTY